MVPKEDEVSTHLCAGRFQQGIACPACRLFNTDFLFVCQTKDICHGDAAGDSKPVTGSGGMTGICHPFGAQTMVNAQGRELQLKSGTEQGKNAGQGSGICSSRNRQQQVAATSKGQIPQTEAFHRKAEQGQWP